MGVFLVERYWPGVTETAAAAAATQARVATDAMCAEGVEVRLLSSSLVLADEAVFSYYEATSADAVEEANRRAGLPVDRVSSCVQVATSASSGPDSEETR